MFCARWSVIPKPISRWVAIKQRRIEQGKKQGATKAPFLFVWWLIFLAPSARGRVRPR